MRRRVIAITVGLFISGVAHAGADSFSGCWPITLGDVAALNPPRFDQYASARAFRGKPAAVDLTSSPRAKTFRTVLRLGQKAGPNFDGHYTVVGWGCGTSCLEFAIVDAESGAVYFPPFRSVSSVHVYEAPGEPLPTYWALRYQLDSSLLVVLGAPDDNDDLEGISYYRWTGVKLILVRHFRSLKDRDC